MKKFGTLLIVLMIASLVLVACQPKEETPVVETNPQNETGNEIVVEQPSTGFKPNLAGKTTECTLGKLIPEIPADQVPPVPMVSADDWVLGSLDAEISIIEYSDFQCPYCAIAAPQLEQFFNDNADKVNLAFRHLPLPSIHSKAYPAHQAAEAAGLQGKFFEMHDLLFAEQQSWAADTVSVEGFLDYALGLAEKLDLDLTQFEKDYNSEEILNKITLSYTDATENIGISGTPTVFIVINGVPYSASYDYNTLSSIVKLIELDKNRYTECPPMVVDVSKVYQATITTSKGDFTIELYPEKAPLAVNSFVFLAVEGFYNNVEFHRVIPGFVAQVGDPSGLGMGGPGYKYANEVSDLKFDSEGVLGVANSGVDTNGSQFFITYAAQTALDGGYTVFGKVIEGMDVVTSLNAVDPQQGITAETLDKILSITITEK
ncbi:MAG: peptidylprolyl isomerase [Anaerolineaceae bacterium]|nr:peptidylprolyl isomerase [Anaerolineaceae bacterium]